MFDHRTAVALVVIVAAPLLSAGLRTSGRFPRDSDPETRTASQPFPRTQEAEPWLRFRRNEQPQSEQVNDDPDGEAGELTPDESHHGGAYSAVQSAKRRQQRVPESRAVQSRRLANRTDRERGVLRTERILRLRRSLYDQPSERLEEESDQNRQRFQSPLQQRCGQRANGQCRQKNQQ